MVTVSSRGVLEIAELEGIVPAPYKDSKGIWTFGIGHTAYAGDPDPAEMPKGMPADIMPALQLALTILARDISRVEARIRTHVKVPLQPHQVDALASVDLNTGFIYYKNKVGKLVNAVAIDKLNAGDYQGCADAFLNWLKPPELKKRRESERNLFLTGDYDRNGTRIPIWSATLAGRLNGIIKTIEGDELLKLMNTTTVSTPIEDWLRAAPAGAIEWLRAIPNP